MPRTIVRVSHSGMRLAGVLAGVAGLAIVAFLLHELVTPTKASVRDVTTADSSPTVDSRATGDSRPQVQAVELASPGRIEGKSESIEVGAPMDGVIQSILVKEGHQVARGEVLAQLDCRDIQSELPVAQAQAEGLRQVRERLLRGSRPEERAAAEQKTSAAKAVLVHASDQMERQRPLAESGIISRASFDDARRDRDVAEAEYQQAMRNEELVKAGPLPEEVAKADADLRTAQERIRFDEQKLEKCVVRAPLSGTVLRVLLRSGESFALVSPRPILTMADLSSRRVRAEVDERDVGKVHIGQRVVVYSEAYAGRRFTGKVTELAPVMGRKSVLTGDPAEKTDRDILEVVAELDGPAKALPLGLRVTVEFSN